MQAKCFSYSSSGFLAFDTGDESGWEAGREDGWSTSPVSGEGSESSRAGKVLRVEGGGGSRAEVREGVEDAREDSDTHGAAAKDGEGEWVDGGAWAGGHGGVGGVVGYQLISWRASY